MSSQRALPGFGLSVGITVSTLSVLVLLPLGLLVARGLAISPAKFVEIVASQRALAAFRLTFFSALLAAFTTLIVGFLAAWCIVRYRFPGRRLLQSLVDLPFALPTAVAGIALTALYARDGFLGSWLFSLFGIKVAYTPLGIFLAMVFLGMPFTIRAVEPLLEDFDPELEEASKTLGAGRFRTFWSVIFPSLIPGCITGFALAFARGVGEYGSLIFISGNMPLKTEVVSVLIMGRLETFDYQGATALALVMLFVSLLILSIVNFAQAYLSAARHSV